MTHKRNRRITLIGMIALLFMGLMFTGIPARAADPKLDIDPDHGAAGIKVTLTAKNFTFPQEMVVLYEGVYKKTITLDADPYEFKFDIPNGSDAGDHQIRLCEADGEKCKDGGQRANVTYTVDAPAATNTPTITPTPTITNTPVPPTNTPVPPTAVPPTGVPPTRVPPTNVPPTQVPPTNTPLPGVTITVGPTNTPAPTLDTAPTATVDGIPIGGNCVEKPVDQIPAAVVDAFAAETEDYRASVWLVCTIPPSEVDMAADSSFDIPAPIRSFKLLDCTSTGICVQYEVDEVEDGRLIYRSPGVAAGPSCAEGCAFAQIGSTTLPFVYPLLCILMIGIAGIGLGVIWFLGRTAPPDEAMPVP